MDIGFTGTQKGMTGLQKQVLKKTLKTLTLHDNRNVGHYGDCIGADAEFAAIAGRLRIILVSHPTNIAGKRAYTESSITWKVKPPLDRNHDIVNCSEVLIACPKEKTEVLRSGTWATIRYALKQGKKVYVIYSDGTYRSGRKRKC